MCVTGLPIAPGTFDGREAVAKWLRAGEDRPRSCVVAGGGLA